MAEVKKEGRSALEGAPEPSANPELDKYHHLFLYDVPVVTKGKSKGEKFEGSAYYDRIPKALIEKWKDKEITREDWRPDDATEMDEGFYDFIDSHIPRFNNLGVYEPFFLYIEQARRWLEETDSLEDIDPSERFEWKQRELSRIADNKLYGLNRYATIKEDGFAGGRRKFIASAPHALVAYICDRGNHFDLVKGRQAAVTSMMMAIVDLDMVTMPSWTGVFMVHKKDGTGKTLFRDKHQSTLQHFPTWITGEFDVAKGFSAESTIIDFDPGTTKATKGMDISEFRLLSAEDSMTVNGRTPTRSLFDECQNIHTYQKIKGEIAPTLYQQNPETGKYDLVRSIWAWGTGSSNASGQGSFENDFKGLLDAWQGRQPTQGWVPLFFDWTCRPGMRRDFYNDRKNEYLRGTTEETKGLSDSERLSLFSAHYPSKPDDAFMSTHKTLIPMEYIIRQQQRISSLCINAEPSLAPVPGRFVPIFNEAITLHGDNYYEHPVIGVRWEPSAIDDITAPVKMFMDRPSKPWINRFFQGTDPIQNDGGFSRFSSVIWDQAAGVVGEGNEIGYLPTVACVLNSRSYNPADLFVQCALMGMYYANHGQKACKELVEINVGHRYVDFKCSPILGLRESLLTRHQLLPKYRTGQAKNIYGVDLKGGSGSRKSHLYADIVELLLANWHNIWYYDIWSQIRHIAVESKPDGSVVWGTQNKNVYNDDIVYAMGYAELCARCINKSPEEISLDTPRFRYKTVIERDANHNPIQTRVKVPVKYA